MFSTTPPMQADNPWPWLPKIDNLNLLTILDVLLDIKHEADLHSLLVVVPILSLQLKFRELLPVDTTQMRDIYLKGRWAALQFLESKAVISALTRKEAPNRWLSTVSLLPNRPVLEDLLKQVMAERGRREQKMDQRAVKVNTVFWEHLHPTVVKFAKPRFESGHLADAIEACLKEVNAAVKARNKERTGKEYDGADLMKNTFSPKNPVITLADLSTESGKNEQQGYMEIFAGTMTGIRNPKAHGNIVIDEKRAIHLLYLASLLMYKLDEAK